ncbi:flavin reductase family protein [Pontiella agarivorans]|uniref:Flavin reductase family protein n=1 Tax=Pontiella agarivorans TaxID=3038953 RepID=A0ABU5MTN0_9BACT|nr:flavin reductase family protein [Pontiella agarivorans]MDZ8117502.1 flavin reductase family protein [Pontiella agarivorans]
MELDFDQPELKNRAYYILSSLVTPRPIALVTTINKTGAVNAAPFSFFNLMGARPPICVFAPGNRDEETPKDTVLNIRENNQFVVNLVDEDIAEAMNACAASVPYGEDELKLSGLNPAESSAVQPPRISEAPASLECEAYDTLEIGNNRMVIGLIKRVHVRDEIYDAEAQRINAEHLKTIGRMAAPHWYCKTSDRFEMIRPE